MLYELRIDKSDVEFSILRNVKVLLFIAGTRVGIFGHVLHKASINFVKAVHPSAHLSAWNNSAPN